jgi:hypothetical protein
MDRQTDRQRDRGLHTLCSFYDLIRTKTVSYVEHGSVGHWHKFPSCEAELLGRYDIKNDERVLERNRSSYPIAFPGGISYTVCLKIFKLIRT